MNYIKLRDELTNDPEGRGYSGMTDAEVVVSLHVVDRTRNRTSLTGTKVLNAIDKGEYNALTDAGKDRVWQVLHMGTINPFGIEADLFSDIFGPPSATITTLKAIRVEAITRADELGLGRVGVGSVTHARTL